MENFKSIKHTGVFPSKKTMNVMKLSCVLLIFSLLQVAAKGFTQNTFITLQADNISLEQLFTEIEKQTDVKFLYRYENVAGKKLKIDAENVSLAVVLDEALHGNNLKYTLMENNLIVVASESVALQGITVTGVVTDTGGDPLPGVSVRVKGTNVGDATGADGRYSVTLPDGVDATLVFSYIGFVTVERTVGNRREINVILDEDTRQIDEVVVVGYGTQRKAILTGSVAAIKSEKLTIAPIANVTNTLAGQLPGLIAKYTGGQPGSDAAALSIRGFGSPLVIVDGVESSFSNLDPSQIESVSILKDGAASIYGARAGNGVILVTSKRGTDIKPTITVNTSCSMQGVTRRVKPASSGQWAQMEREIHLNSGQPEESVPWTQEAVAKFFAGNDPAYPNADWYGFIIRPFAPMQNHNLSIRGGSDKIKYYGFFGYTDQETMIKEKGGAYQRYNIQSNIDAKVTQNLKLSVDLSLIYDDHFFTPRGMTGASYYLWNDIYGSRPWYPTTFPDPTKIAYGGLDTGSAYAMSNTDIYGYNHSKNRNIRGGISLEYDFSKFVKGLKAKAFINYRDDEGYGKSFQRPVTTYTYNPTVQEYTVATNFPTQSTLNESVSRSNLLTQQYSVNYENTFSETHRLSAFVMYESMNYYNHWFSASRRDFMTPAIDQMYAGSTVGMSNGGSASEMGRVSYVGRLNYSFRDKYLLETILRADASAKFDSVHRWGYFPSVSVGWVMSQEGFMENNSLLEYLKLRASYGQSGNDGVANFNYLAGYAVSGSDTYILGNTPVKGLYATGLANPTLTWEKMTISNAGIDFTFTDRVLYGTVEFFYRDRKGIPATRLTSLPSTFGAILPVENLNHISTRGFELQLGTVLKTSDLTFDVSGNISWSRSRYEYYEEPEYEDLDQKRIYQLTGRWTDVAYRYKSDGLFTSQEQINALDYTYSSLGGGNAALRPGDVKLLDTNHDGVLDWKDLVKMPGASMPLWMYGLNTIINYRGFDLNALFQGAFGYITNVDYGTFFKYDKMYELRWTEENNNPNALVARLGGVSSGGGSDYHNKSTSYLRLKSLSLGYELPDRMLSKVGITKLRLYLAGTNLFTVSTLNKYGLDPEAPAIYSYYPQQRTYSIGLNFSF